MPHSCLPHFPHANNGVRAVRDNATSSSIPCAFRRVTRITVVPATTWRCRFSSTSYRCTWLPPAPGIVTVDLRHITSFALIPDNITPFAYVLAYLPFAYWRHHRLRPLAAYLRHLATANMGFLFPGGRLAFYCRCRSNTCSLATHVRGDGRFDVSVRRGTSGLLARGGLLNSLNISPARRIFRDVDTLRSRLICFVFCRTDYNVLQHSILNMTRYCFARTLLRMASVYCTRRAYSRAAAMLDGQNVVTNRIIGDPPPAFSRHHYAFHATPYTYAPACCRCTYLRLTAKRAMRTKHIHNPTDCLYHRYLPPRAACATFPSTPMAFILSSACRPLFPYRACLPRCATLPLPFAVPTCRHAR